MAKKYAARQTYDSPFGMNSPFIKDSPLKKTSFDVWDILPREDCLRIKARTATMKDFKREYVNDLDYWSGHVYQDRKQNNTFDQNDRYKYFLTIFTSRDADGLVDLYLKLQPLKYEIIFLMEDNSRDTNSTPTYFVKMGANVQANLLVDPEFINVKRITDLIIEHGIPYHQINPQIVKDVLGKSLDSGKVAYKNLSFKEVVWGMYTPFLESAADITGAIGDGINKIIKLLDHIKIDSTSWNYAIGDPNMDLFFFPGYESQAKPIPAEDVKELLNRLKENVEKSFKPATGNPFHVGLIGEAASLSGISIFDMVTQYLKNDVFVSIYHGFSDLMDDLEETMDRMVEGGVLFVNGFLCGFWNSIVSCVQGILFLFYLAFKATSALFAISSRPEAMDHFIQTLEDFDFKAFITEVTTLFKEAWEVFKTLDWAQIASEIKVAQIGYFVGGLAEFILEILVGGLVPGVGLAATILGKSGKIFGEIFETLAKIFRKIVPNKPGTSIDFSKLTLKFLQSNTDDLIAAIRSAKKMIVLWLRNLHLIVRGVSWETIQKLERLGLRVRKLNDVAASGFARRLTDEGVWEILRDGNPVYRLKGTEKEVDELLQRLAKLTDDQIEKVRKMTDDEFGRYLDDLKKLKQVYTREAIKIDVELLAKIRQNFGAGKRKNVALTKGEIDGVKIELQSRSGGQKGQLFDDFEPVPIENYRYIDGPHPDI